MQANLPLLATPHCFCDQRRERERGGGGERASGQQSCFSSKSLTVLSVWALMVAEDLVSKSVGHGQYSYTAVLGLEHPHADRQETERQTDRQTQRERDRHRETDRQRQTDTERDRQTQRETDRHRERQTDTERDRHRQTDTERDRQTERDSQTE